MRRAVTAGLVAAVVLPSAVLAASAGAPLPAVLPTPVVTEPRLAYADAEQRILAAVVRQALPVPGIAPAPGSAEDGGLTEGDGGGAGGAGDGLGGGAIVEGDPAALAPGAGGTGARLGAAAAALPAVGGVFSVDRVVPLEQDHRYDAEASSQQPGGQPSGSATPAPSAFVSVRDQAETDVYLRYEAAGSVEPRLLRVTCDAAVDSHPVISPDGTRVAWTTDRDGTWSIALAQLPPALPADDDWCEEVAATTELVTGDLADETWPAWTPRSDRIVYAGTESDPLGDLWSLDAGTHVAVQLTSGPAADSQPAVTARSGAYVVAFTTTRFRADGSIAFAWMLGDGRPLRPVIDAYANDQAAAPVQGSEPAWGYVDYRQGWLAFTSRAEDPTGDIWVAELGPTEEPWIGAQEPVVANRGRTESHPSWRSGWERTDSTWSLQATLSYTDGRRLIDVHDVRADGSGDLRVLANRVEVAPTDTPSPPAPEPLHELSPAYHPAGDELAYASELAELGANNQWRTSQVLRSTPADANAGTVMPFPPSSFDAEPSWSPDGTKLAFRRSPDPSSGARTRLYVADFSGPAVTVTQVTAEMDGMVTEDHDPTWTPDGSRLLFSRWVLRDRGAGLSDAIRFAVVSAGVWWVDADGGLAAQQLERPRGDGCEEDCTILVTGRAPTLSPDGTRLAVVDLAPAASGTDEGVPYALGAALGGIGILDLDVTADPPAVLGARALTGVRDDGSPTPSRATVDGTDNPAWSPDGTEVAFSAHRAGMPQQRGIWAVQAADGSGLRLVTDTQGVQDEPAYRPHTNLTLTLAATPSTDGSATLTVTVTNAGPGLVRTGQVDVELPAGVSTPGVPGCTVAGQQLTCPLASALPAGATPLVLTVPVQGVTETTGPVTAVVTSTSPERDVTDNTATVTPVVARAYALSVSVAVAPPVLWVGGLPSTATFTVTNLGTAPLTDVALTTAFPGVLTTTGSASAPCTQASGTCTLGTLAPGTPVTLTSELRSVDFTGPPQTGAVTATVTTSSPDPVPEDDTASAPVEVRAPELLVSPGVTRPGGVAFVAGRWFPPGDSVRLGWDVGIMSVPGPYPVLPDGTFQASVPVVADTLLGPRALLGTGTTAGPLFGDVEVGVLVNPNTVAAPSFLFRD